MSPHSTGPGLALVLAFAACLPVAQAQSHSSPAAAPHHTTPPNESWTRANNRAAQFPRGHLDLLRWEQNNTPAGANEGQSPPDAATLSLSQAQHMALQNQPRWLGRAGMSAAEIARLNTQAQERMLQVRRAWIEAVAARQSAHYSRDILEAAEAGAELAERMARLGNWSRARQMQEELLLWDARTRSQNAELQALQSALALWQLTGGPAPDTESPLGDGHGAAARKGATMEMPTAAPTSPSQPPSLSSSAPQALQPERLRLPPLPDLPMPERQPLAWLEERAMAANAQWAFAQADAARQRAGQHANSLTQGRRAMAQALAAAPSDVTGQSIPLLSGRTPWNHSTETALQAQADAEILERRIRADVHMAHATYESARTQAAHSRHEVLRLHTALQQESLLRYNGMLKSTWDLLASARQRIQSVDAAHQAQRQAWLAWADLQAVLNGLPYTGSLSAASSTPNPPTAGH